jgi:hypothetical protein
MSRKIDPQRIEVVDDAIAEILRSKSVTERIAMAADANDTARCLVAAGVRHAHPEWSESDMQREIARRMLGASN